MLRGASTTRSRPVNRNAFCNTFFESWSNRFILLSLADDDDTLADVDDNLDVLEDCIKFDIVLHAICILVAKDSISRNSGKSWTFIESHLVNVIFALDDEADGDSEGNDKSSIRSEKDDEV